MASRRTTTDNAYVSGLGATRRIVVYDTLLTSASPDEVRLVVAHELGHAKRNDVLVGTIEGALAAAAAVCGLYLLFSWAPLLRRAGPWVSRAPVPVTLVEGVAERLPFDPGSFDSAIVTYSLCSMSEPARALAEVRRVLRPGGELVFV